MCFQDSKNADITKLDEEKQKFGIEQRQLNAQLNEQRRLLGAAETAVKAMLDQRNQRLDDIRKTNYDVHKSAVLSDDAS